MLDTREEDDVREHVVAFMRLRKVTNSSGSACRTVEVVQATSLMLLSSLWSEGCGLYVNT